MLWSDKRPETAAFGRRTSDGAPRLLIVDEARVRRRILARLVEMVGFQPVQVGSLADLARVLAVGMLNGAIIDLSLGERNGTALFNQLAQSDFSGPVVVVSGGCHLTTRAAIQFGMSLGLDMRGSVPRPVDLPALRECFADVIRR